ncbi:hypothetical protein [Streptomyces huasconensis]|uniref:hypothetical protein n=1 Tax=Streptomyces huasconensis TaxID=1854574 RepID=UPI0033FF6F33
MTPPERWRRAAPSPIAARRARRTVAAAWAALMSALAETAVAQGDRNAADGLA